MTRILFLSLSCLLLSVAACKKNKKDCCVFPPNPCGEGALTNIAYSPTPYDIAVPSNPPFPPLEIPMDNPMTAEGVELGRRLFYDPILSADSTMSCFSCHLQNNAFADDLATSTGIDNIAGTRSSMPLLNMAWNHSGFFWDGRSASLEEQALHPVEDSIELHDTWENVTCKLSNHDTYPELFRKAFGIEDKSEITKELTAKAIAQFERTIVAGNSRFDQFLRLEIFLEEDELNGHDMFFDLAMDKVRFPDAECGHCHGGPLLTFNEYRNNGIEESATLEDFPDLGLGGISGFPADNGRFRTPTLRNIEQSAPYMHDGRFETLEEVIEHYSSGGKNSPNKDPLIYPLNLTATQKAELVAFIKTLTDNSITTNPAYQNPF